MKKLFAFLLAILIVIMAVPFSASAQKQPQLNISVSPEELVQGGSVTVNVEIYNPTDTEIKECMLIIDGEDVKEYPGISAQGSVQYSGKYNVSSNKLGKAIPVQFTYDGGTVKDSFTVGKKSPTVKVSTTVKVDSTTVTKGKESSFTFAIDNQGDATMENIKLTASPLNGGKALADTFNLAEGKATMVTYSQKLESDTKISPQISFTVAGKEYTKTMDSVSVKVIDPEIKLTISVQENEVEPDKEFTVEAYIENSGNANFKSVELYDSNDERVPIDKSSLSAGEYISAERTMKLSSSTEIGFYVKATDENGETHTFNSNVIKINVTERDPDEYAKLLLMKVEADQPELDKKGPAKFKITIENNADISFTNLKITEKTLGEINTFPTIKANDKIEFDVQTVEDIEDETQFEFMLTAEDPDGNEVEINAEPVVVTLAKNSGGSLGTVIIIVIVIIVLIIGVGVTILILMKKDKQKKKEAAQKRTAAVQGGARSIEEKEKLNKEEPLPSTAQRAKIKPAGEEENSEEPKDMSSFGEPDEPEDTPTKPTGARKVRRRDFDDRNNF